MPPVRETGQLRLVLPQPAQRLRPVGAGPSGQDLGVTGCMLDMGARRQFRPGPFPQGAHGLVREQTVYDLGAGPVSSPRGNRPTWKDYSSTRTTEKAKGDPGEKTEAQRLTNGEMVPKEA